MNKEESSMGSYAVIEEIGNEIVTLLRQNLVPEFVGHQENIDLCSPDEKGDITVGIYLYDIQESEGMIGIEPKNRGVVSQCYPSLFLELYYMITVYSNSDVKFRARQEQKLLGRILQIFHENKRLPENDTSRNPDYPTKIEMERLKLEDKLKIYNAPGKAYKSSLFYRVYPVELESTQRKKVYRVTDVNFSVNEEKER